MQTIPIQPVPSQKLRVQLSDQDCVINVYQRSTGVYLDLQVDGRVIVMGSLCRDRVKIVRQEYLGFKGDIAFMDTSGKEDPAYAGFGGRFLLVYLES